MRSCSQEQESRQGKEEVSDDGLDWHETLARAIKFYVYTGRKCRVTKRNGRWYASVIDAKKTRWL